jgi:hypothetical protein
MSRSLTLFAVCVACAGAFGQSFECYPLGPLPTDPAVSCEGVVSNNYGFPSPPATGTAVTSNPSCGFPTNGTQYVVLTLNGPAYQPPLNQAFNPPIGGPFPRPIPQLVTELRIPIPNGATSITMDWEFFNRECANTSFYDGASIDVVNSSGGLVANLLYVDTLSPESACSVGTDYCGLTMGETAPAGPNTLNAALPPLAGCEYVSIAAWNGGDNGFPGMFYVDNVVFNALPPACPVPCIVLSPGPPTLSMSSPSGSGCVQVDLTNMPAAGFYFLAATLQQGAFPNGWFFGIDIGFPELQNEINTGFPFLGALSGSACSPGGGATIGQFCGLPPGLTFYAVGLGAPPGSGYPSAITNSTSYTIP